MISPDAIVVAGSTIAVLGLQQWFMHRQNRKQYEHWMQLLSFLLQEYPLHRHDPDGKVSYPKVKLRRPQNGKMEWEQFT